MPAVVFSPAAIEEAREGYAWYRERSPRVAAAFWAEIERALLAVERHPEGWPPFEAGTRRSILMRFPYYLIYRQRGDSIEIIAVMHAAREPGYWRTG